MKEKEIVKKLIQKILKNNGLKHRDFMQLKRQFAKQYKIPILTNITILKHYRQLAKQGKIKENKSLFKLLKRREIRTLSGVAIITVLTKPYPCPGRCLYCPNEAGMPKSYLKKEPAAQRAWLSKFDPAKQVKIRLEALKLTGHETDKIEMIILGGSWTHYPKKYQERFIKRLFEACNNRPAKSLEQAQKLNETAKNRIIGLSVETRPDLITKKEALWLRKLGVTRVEIGVQTIYPEILKKNNRGHTIKEIVNATQILKDFGFKIIYHLMPNLPGSTPQKDLNVFKMIFSDEKYQPDMLKIYPCLVLKTAPLYKLWQQGKYKPYSEKQLNDLLIKIKKIVPYYVRINRLIRDIPASYIMAGNKITNLRQLIQEKGVKCNCIRCREARRKKIKAREAKLFIRKYVASKGTEYFISFESPDKKILYAFLRLRLPDLLTVPFENEKTAIIRELHTYGELVPIKEKNEAIQHTGLGKRLMLTAEKIAKEKKYQKMAVISGIGVRDYYRKLGYRLEDTYMVKNHHDRQMV
jgi:elongator complex protein 3